MENNKIFKQIAMGLIACLPLAFNAQAEDFLWADADGWNQEKHYSTIKYPDINGDGLDDVCARSAVGVECHLRTVSGNWSTAISGPPWADSVGWDEHQYYSSIEYPDINGDGKDDVCGRSTYGIWCHLSLGNSFATSVTFGPGWTSAGGWRHPQYYETIQYADINGDGKADVCGRGGSGLNCFLSNGIGFPTKVFGPAWTDATGWTLARHYKTIGFADLNGDGKDDACGRTSFGIHCYLSEGTSFSSTLITGPAWKDDLWSNADKYETIRYVDIDGDNFADVCGRTADGIACYTNYNNTKLNHLVTGPDWSDANGWDQPERYRGIRFGDVNGDKRNDICAREVQGMRCYYSQSTHFEGYYDGPTWADNGGWSHARHYEPIGMPDFNGDGVADLAARSYKYIVDRLTPNLVAQNYQCQPWDGALPQVGSLLRFKNTLARDRTTGSTNYRTQLGGLYLKNELHGSEPVPKFTGVGVDAATLYQVEDSRTHANGPEVLLTSPTTGLAANTLIGFNGAEFVTDDHSYWPISARWIRLAHTYRAWTDPDCGYCAATVNDKVAPVAVMQRVIGDNAYSCAQNWSYDNYQFAQCNDYYVSFGGYGSEVNRHLGKQANDVSVEVCALKP